MYSQIAANKRKTVIMMVLFVGLVVGLGWLFGQYAGTPFITPYVLIGAAVYALISYYGGSKLALAINGAHEIQKTDNPRLWRVVENLSITDGLPMPRVFVIDDPALNAFATGRDPKRAIVCATTGLLEAMEDSELEGVMAHELGHVKNYDIRVSMIAFALVAVVSIIADIMLRMAWFRDDDDSGSGTVFIILGIVGAILAPIIATLIQLSISRRREYLADATGALTTRYPEGLASALEKIKHTGSTMKRQNASTAHLFFANPLKGHKLATLFSTHPPIDDRIQALRVMGTKA
ncbi:M48 family metalloprotease [Candidatus Saccharibacteria bacterium]|nr:M48 family metalloprotease [Candidatus Saccharibacteria bacterium]MBI3337861.1 M48 family metalloprotease [Candidatus Saccharibacteria bacterium]